VPGYTPAFSFGGLHLWWAVIPCESASVGAGDVVEAAEPEPELEDAQEAAAVAQCQRLAAMVGKSRAVCSCCSAAVRTDIRGHIGYLVAKIVAR
jgi:hypothetical protein